METNKNKDCNTQIQFFFLCELVGASQLQNFIKNRKCGILFPSFGVMYLHGFKTNNYTKHNNLKSLHERGLSLA